MLIVKPDVFYSGLLSAMQRAASIVLNVHGIMQFTAKIRKVIR